MLEAAALSLERRGDPVVIARHGEIVVRAPRFPKNVEVLSMADKRRVLFISENAPFPADRRVLNESRTALAPPAGRS